MEIKKVLSRSIVVRSIQLCLQFIFPSHLPHCEGGFVWSLFCLTHHPLISPAMREAATSAGGKAQTRVSSRFSVTWTNPV